MDSHIPGFPNIGLSVWLAGADAGDVINVTYWGNVADILAAGITTADVLKKRSPKGPRPPRLDADGGKLRVQFWSQVRDGAVVPRVKVTFPRKPLAACRKLPGFNAAWDLAQQRYAAAQRLVRESKVRRSEPDMTADEKSRVLASGMALGMVGKYLWEAGEPATVLANLRELMKLSAERSGGEGVLLANGRAPLGYLVEQLRRLPNPTAPALRLVVDNTR